MANIAIVGSGFRGIFDALILSQNKKNKITIYDKANFFGGISRSRKICGFNVDMGVHMFDSIQKELYQIVSEVMDGKMQTIDFISQSAYKNSITDGYSLPDLSSESDLVKKNITSELYDLASNPQKAIEKIKKSDKLNTLLINRYGETAGKIFSGIFRKVYNIEAEFCDCNALNKTSLGRLKYLDDESMITLKQDKYLDTILAARRKSIGIVDNYVSGYPSDGNAMGGFCDRVQNLLSNRDVEIRLGRDIKIELKKKHLKVSEKENKINKEFDHLIWAADNLNPLLNDLSININLDKYLYKTPMIFAVLVTDFEHIKNFTYMQNFSHKSITYRTSAAGIYSNQKSMDNKSFLTAECPCSLDNISNIDEKDLINKIWKEVKKLKIVDKNAELYDFKLLKVAKSFQVPKIGFSKNYELASEQLNHYSDLISYHSLKLFFRRELYQESKDLTEIFN